MPITQPADPTSAPSKSGESKYTTVAWQGWQLDLPAKFSPVKVEGDYQNGHALFADLHRPRLGVRWQSPKHLSRVNPTQFLDRILRQEIGVKAIEDARPLNLRNPLWRESILYAEPNPPGRDVWVGFSAVSGRAITIVYHCSQRQYVLQDALLPKLEDIDPAHTHHRVPWSIFELSCIVPDKYKLKSQRLNAGDLSLTFASEKASLTVRQVAVASLALTRMPLDKWLGQEEHAHHRQYHPHGQPQKVQCVASSKRPLHGMMRESTARFKYLASRLFGKLPARRYVYALQDEQRDRLVLLDGVDQKELLTVASTVGWARS